MAKTVNRTTYSRLHHKVKGWYHKKNGNMKYIHKYQKNGMKQKTRLIPDVLYQANGFTCEDPKHQRTTSYSYNHVISLTTILTNVSQIRKPNCKMSWNLSVIFFIEFGFIRSVHVIDNSNRYSETCL